MLTVNRHFWKIYICSLIFSSSVIYAATFYIDPLGANYHLNYKGLNIPKPAAVRFDHKIKPYRIKILQPRTLIIGSSRELYSANPMEIRGFPAPIYNAAFEFGQISDALEILQYAIAVAPIKEVIIFFTYGNFFGLSRAGDLDVDLEKPDIVSSFEVYSFAYFSLNAVLGNFETIVLNLLNGEHAYGSTHTGFFSYGGDGKRFGDHKRYVRLGLMTDDAKLVSSDLSPAIELLKIIRQICIDNEVEVQFVLGPFPPEHIELRKEFNTWSAVEDWKNELRKIIPFSDFFDENTPFLNNDFYDRVHYTREVGKVIIDSLKHP